MQHLQEYSTRWCGQPDVSVLFSSHDGCPGPIFTCSSVASVGYGTSIYFRIGAHCCSTTQGILFTIGIVFELQHLRFGSGNRRYATETSRRNGQIFPANRSAGGRISGEIRPRLEPHPRPQLYIPNCQASMTCSDDHELLRWRVLSSSMWKKLRR